MAIIDCPKCGKKISDKAPECVHCARERDGRRPLPPAARILILLAVLVGVLFLYGQIKRSRERAELLRIAGEIPEERACEKADTYARLLLVDRSLEPTYGEAADRYQAACKALKAREQAERRAQEERVRQAREREARQKEAEKQRQREIARQQRERRADQNRKKAVDAVKAVRRVLDTAAKGGDPDIFARVFVDDGIPSHLCVSVKPIWHLRNVHLKKNDLLVLTRIWEKVYGPTGFVSFYSINGDEVGGRKMLGGLWVEGLDQ